MSALSDDDTRLMQQTCEMDYNITIYLFCFWAYKVLNMLLTAHFTPLAEITGVLLIFIKLFSIFSLE